MLANTVQATNENTIIKVYRPEDHENIVENMQRGNDMFSNNETVLTSIPEETTPEQKTESNVPAADAKTETQTKNEEVKNVETVLQEAVEALDETEEEQEKSYEWSTEILSTRSILKRYKENKIVLPLFQRLYIWDKQKRQSLFRSIKSNLPCGTIVLVEIGGTQYLVDGLQRVTSLFYLSKDEDKLGFTADDKKAILDYKVPVTTVHDMSLEDAKNYFGVLNSGVALASVVKERSKLPENLNNAVLEVSSHKFFREVESNAIFKKNHHHELIALNALVAAAGLPQPKNSGKELCSAIKENEELILGSVEKAKELVDQLEFLYRGIDPQKAKRSLNANFVGTLVYLMVSEQYDNRRISQMIEFIYEERKIYPEYAATTRSSASSAENCKRRLKVMKEIINSKFADIVSELNNDTNNENKDSDEEFRSWRKENSGKAIRDSHNEYVVDFSEFTSMEQFALYKAQQAGNTFGYDGIVEQVYKRLENE